MDTIYLNTDVLINVLSSLSETDVMNYCESDPKIKRLCETEDFYRNMLFQRYNLDINKIAGKSSKDKYKYVMNLIIRADTDDFSVFKNLYVEDKEIFYGKNWFRYSELFEHMDDYNLQCRKMRDIMVDAVKSDNGDFFDIIVERVFSRILPEKYPRYGTSFREAFIEAMKLGNTSIITTIMLYYDQLNDEDYYMEVLRPVERLNDVKLFKLLYAIKGPIGNDEYLYYKQLVIDGKYKIADIVRLKMMTAGDDPLNPDYYSVDFELYRKMIQLKDKEGLRYLLNLTDIPDGNYDDNGTYEEYIHLIMTS